MNGSLGSQIEWFDYDLDTFDLLFMDVSTGSMGVLCVKMTITRKRKGQSCEISSSGYHGNRKHSVFSWLQTNLRKVSFAEGTEVVAE